MRRGRVPRRVRGPGLPWKSFFILVGGLFLLIIVLGVGLDFVSDRVSLRAALVAREQSALLEEIEQLERRNIQLTARVASLERAQQIDREAQSQVERALESSQERSTVLESQLLFYKTILKGDVRANEAQIHQLVLQSLGESAYRFKLVLNQLPNKRYRTRKGVVELRIKGLKNNDETVLDQAALGLGKSIAYSFKYFQELDGEFQLPAGFEPANLQVRLTPKGKKKPTVDASYDWTDLLKAQP